MTAIPVALALSIAAQVVPSAAPDTIVAFAQLESNLEPLSLHDNTTGKRYAPKSKAAAVGLATELLSKHHSIDAGIMQVNSTNFATVGLSIDDAFDVEKSMRAGGVILLEAYRRCRRGEEATSDTPRATALRCAASIYNTGNELRGVESGYTARFEWAAAQIIPSVRELLGQPSVTSTSAIDKAPTPPTATGWDVFARRGGTPFVFTGEEQVNAR
jgi:type IV secretion system protein VirB1